MTSDRSDAARLWRLYAEHAAVILGAGPRPAFHATDRWFLAATGSADLGLNLAALYGDADADDAEHLTQRVREADIPCLLGCSAGVLERATPALTRAGFARLPKREAIFRRVGRPDGLKPSPFEVRRVGSAADVVAMRTIFEAGHRDVPQALIGEDRGVTRHEAISAWLAWDGTQPISFVAVVTIGGSMTIWEVMTPERHRRRGAARAVVNAALAGAAAAADGPIEETLFWASPAGRPLYEAMGFVVADDVDSWTLGASAEDIAAVGA